MKVRVTLELEVEDGLDDRGSVDMAVESALYEFGVQAEVMTPEYVWKEYKINWEAV